MTKTRQRFAKKRRRFISTKRRFVRINRRLFSLGRCPVLPDFPLPSSNRRKAADINLSAAFFSA